MKKIKLLTSALMLSLCTFLTPVQSQAGPIVLRACTNASPEFAFAKAFDDMADYVQKHSNGRYRMDVYAGGKLGSDAAVFQAIQLGTVHFLQLSSSNAVSFFPDFGVFDMPYLFPDIASFRAVFDGKLGEEIAKKYSNDKFKVCLFSEVDFRKLFTARPIKTFDQMKGLKIRVQQSPASVQMMEAFGAAASPMSFGEVYTAIQQGVIDGAENNELALTNNKHGEVAKYFSYNKHQMVPDMLIGNLKFLNSLSDEEREVFEEAARLSTEVELEEWDGQVEEAKRIAEEDMGVEFIDVDIQAFKDQVAGVQEDMLEDNENIRDIYDHIQEVNAKYTDGEAE